MRQVSRADNERRDVFDERAIHLGAGFKEQERPHVLVTLAALGGAPEKVESR